MAMPSITRCRFTVLLLLAGLAPLLPPVRLPAQDRVAAARSGRPRQRREPNGNLLTPEQWKQLDRSVERGVGFIVKNQQEDGGFPTSASGQPAINSLCVMALLSRGHQPGKGPYGAKIERAIDYVLDMQDPRTGAIMQDRRLVGSRTDDLIYSHAISGVMLGEVYGMTTASRHDRIRSAILKGLKFTRKSKSAPSPTRTSAAVGGTRSRDTHRIGPFGDGVAIDVLPLSPQCRFRRARNLGQRGDGLRASVV